MSARNERAKDIAGYVVIAAVWAFLATAIIGGVLTGHYEPLFGALIAAPVLAFVWWITS